MTKWVVINEEGKVETAFDEAALDEPFLIHCPVCGNPLWSSKDEPGYKFCVKCRRRYVRFDERLIELLTRLSKKYIDGKVIYWEFEGVARRELDIDHKEFWDLVEKLEEEGKIETKVIRGDLYLKPKERGDDGERED